MKTKRTIQYRSLGGATCAGAFLLLAASASAQISANLFVSNFTLGNVYEYAPPNATPTTYASGLDYPYGIAFDSSGDLYIANTDLDAPGDHGYVTKITPGGTVSTYATGLDPKGMAVNSAGNLFVGDYKGGEIYEYINGVQSTFATGFNTPMDMAFDRVGDLFVAGGYGNGNGYITEIENNVNKTQISFATGLSFPNELAFNGAGDLFVADSGSGNIYEYINGVQSTFSSVSGLGGIAFDNLGNLYASSSGSGAIFEYTPHGESTFATESGNPTQLAFQPVPEPSALGLIGAGAVAFFGFRSAKKSKTEKA